MGKILSPGTEAPNFTLMATPDQPLTLQELRGKTVVLVFYPADWSPVCTDELRIINEVLPELRQLGAEVLGISVDGTWSHIAFAKINNIHFPLLSDFEPKGAVAKKYGAYREGAGLCERALFVIDREGKIAWSQLALIGENPGVEGIIEAVEILNVEK